jgi:hypothetical protein
VPLLVDQDVAVVAVLGLQQEARDCVPVHMMSSERPAACMDGALRCWLT